MTVATAATDAGIREGTACLRMQESAVDVPAMTVGIEVATDSWRSLELTHGERNLG